MADIGFLIGALIPTFLISRLFNRIFKSWNAGIKKIVVVHTLSLLLMALIAGMGMADGGAFAPLQAGAKYLIPQIVWFLYDFYKFKKSIPKQ